MSDANEDDEDDTNEDVRSEVDRNEDVRSDISEDVRSDITDTKEKRFLRKLQCGSKTEIKHAIRTASKDMIHQLSEYVQQLVEGDVPLSNSQLRKIKYARELLEFRFADRTKDKRRILYQNCSTMLPLILRAKKFYNFK
jgi:transketolase